MCFRGKLVNSLENLQILPMGNVRHFRRIRKNDVPFLKMCVFFAEFAEMNIFRRNEQGTPAKIGVGHFILDNLTHAYHGRITYPYSGAAGYHPLTHACAS